MEQLCREIRMPQEVTAQVLQWHRRPDFSPNLSELTCEDTWQQGIEALRGRLAPDPGGIKMLCCMLRCALDAWPKYQQLGLSRQIYVDTMGCLSRFVGEHHESYGIYGFDRDFWTVRQISCRLFRIGQLEYELCADGRISLHIPTDVRLELPLLKESYHQARAVIDRVFPAYAGAEMFCCSWLLSPQLRELLPEQSRILAFQRSFSIVQVAAPSQGVVQWVFKNPSLPVEDYPEDTSLQRRLKAYLLAGGIFHDGKGSLAANPFQ